jgi:gliding motility-associated-like protein
MIKWIFSIFIICPLIIHSQCGLCERSVDLIANGDFSDGNTGFTSEMNYVTGIFTCPLCPENTYTLGSNAVFHHSGFSGTDHTNPPNGLFFIANGMAAFGSTVWCQSLDVQPATDYTFSFWARDVTNNSNPHPMAQLFASFNGVWSADSIIAQGGWSQFTVVWNSGNMTSLELCIINNQNQPGGNDFGLDDISFTACEDIHLQQEAFAGEDATICSNETLTLGQNSAFGYQYTWTPSYGLNSSTIGNPAFQVSNTNGMDMSFELIVERDSASVGCVASDTVMVTVLYVPEYTPFSDTIVCPGDMAVFTVSDNWSNVLWDNSISTTTAELAVGSHNILLQYNECEVNDQFDVSAEPMPNLDLPDTHEACEPDGVLLNFDQTVEWSDGTIGNNWLGFESSTVSWTYEQNNCVFRDTTEVIIYQEPTWILGEGIDACDDETVTIDPALVGDWDVVGQQQILTTDVEGDYVFTATIGICSYYFPFEVRMNYTPILQEDIYADYCPDRALEIGVAPVEGWNYTWSNDSIGSLLEVDAEGIYWLHASNACGTDSMRFEVQEIVCSSDLYIPNTFTPNEDGFNDVWRPLGHDISNYHLWIYDQLGQAIYESFDLNSGWIPEVNRIDLAYTYRIEFVDYEGDPHVVTGHINLLR